MRYSFAMAALAAASTVSAYSVPQNLQNIYDSHKSGKCNNKIQGGFDDGSFAYCGDVNGAIYLHSSRNGGQYDNMGIDCDGANRSAGACANDPSGQGQTAFQDLVKKYSHNQVSDLDANKHPYVVFGNEGDNPSFRPQDHGVKPLSVIAVVCNGQLHYGIWGDTNGGTSTGEASLAMGDLYFPNSGLSGDNGHDQHDVLYIAFTNGDAAVPGYNADWTAGDAKAFQKSIKDLGDSLVANL